MPVTMWLFVISTLAPPPADTTMPALQALSVAPEQSQTATAPVATVHSSSNRLGIGGSVAVSAPGAVASVRYWLPKFLGVSLTAEWYRPWQYSADVSSQVPAKSAFAVTPSVLFTPGILDLGRAIGVRPYVGLGAGILHASGPVVRFGPSGPDWYAAQRAQIGAEVLFRQHRGLAIGIEAIGHHDLSLPVRHYYVDGIALHVFAHLYLW